MRRSDRRVASVGVVILLLLLLSAFGPSRAATGPTVAAVPLVTPIPSASGPSVSLVNLLGGPTAVAPSLVYNGFANGGNRSFPVLLTGTNTTKFWASSQPVLELAPQTTIHDAGIVLAPGYTSGNETLSMVGVASSVYSSGDGLEAYLYPTPLRLSNWSFPYFATDPEGANSTLTSPEGAMIFPYSATPYIAVQWDPALGHLNLANLYLVKPLSNGTVNRSTVSVQPVGTGSSALPSPMDQIEFNVSYNLTTDVVSGIVRDDTNSTTVLTFAEALGPDGFSPSLALGSRYFFGAGGSGNGANGWGLLSLSLSAPPTSCASSPSPTGVPSEPVVDLLGGATTVSSSVVYDGFAHGGNCLFPTLLTGSNTSKFWASGQSVLELASTGTTHDSGVVLFNSSTFSNQTLSLVGAASTTYTSGDGLEAYLFLSPLHTSNWSTPYYATDPEGSNGTFINPQGSVIFPYSTTPYVVAQWDPAFGDLNIVTLYLVTPMPGGSITPANVTVLFVGSGTGTTPGSSDYIGLNLTYNVTKNELWGTVSNYQNGEVLTSFGVALGTHGFDPSVTVGSRYVFGAGGSGNGANGWGLLYLSCNRSSRTAHVVEFVESGLPSGTEWWVNLTGGPTNHSTGNALNFSLSDGLYPYSLASADKRYSAPGGALLMNGASQLVTVLFSLFTYRVTVSEFGLPVGTLWWVNISSGPVLQTVPTTNTSVGFDEPNGTYWCEPGTALVDDTAPGEFINVTGAAVSAVLPFSPRTYFIEYTETGLSSGTEWWMNVTGAGSFHSVNSSIYFSEPNGNYSYSAQTADKIFRSSTGTFRVFRSEVTGYVAFPLFTYNVTFVESGLSSGTTWAVDFPGRLESNSTNIVTESHNGTYVFTIPSVPGYLCNITSGNVTVLGRAATVYLAFSPSSNGTSGLSSLEWVAVGVGVAVVVAVGGALVWRRKRKGPSGDSPST